MNETLVVLIPKVPNPDSLKQFRPISICNVIYKIITKLIASRLKRHMAYLVMIVLFWGGIDWIILLLPRKFFIR